jgi:glycosyltransferase involved in cell wall biosynthesis
MKMLTGALSPYAKYRIRLALKKTVSTTLSLLPQKPLSQCPPITIFLSSFNTRYPLQLTIESLRRCTSYANLRFLIAENASTDGSREYLEEVSKKLPIEVIHAPSPRMHKEWLNEMYQTISTPYWFAVDSDMLFMGRDWLADMLRVMESRRDLYLLSAETIPPLYGVVEPVGGEVIDLGERFSTWLFCVRTSLRELLKPEFGFVVDRIEPGTGRKFCYDVGGKLLADMRAKNLAYSHMPFGFRQKFYHFGSLSWSVNGGERSGYQKLKQMQSEDIRRRVS